MSLPLLFDMFAIFSFFTITDFADYHSKRAVDECQHICKLHSIAHNIAITCLAFNATGLLLATGNKNGGACVWSLHVSKYYTNLPFIHSHIKSK